MNAIGQSQNSNIAEIQKITLSDMAIPRLSLVQGTSKMQDAGRHGGDYYNSVTGEFKQTVKAVMLISANKKRAVFPNSKKGDITEDVLCRSYDFLSPVKDYVGATVRGAVIQETCSGCPLQEWGAENEPPECTMMYEFFFMDIETKMPFSISFGKTAIKVAKNLNTIFAAFGAGAVVMLQSRKKESGLDSYYAPDVVLKRDVLIDDDVREVCSSMQYNLISRNATPDVEVF